MSNSLIILILLISITVALLLIFRTRVFGQDNVSCSLKENETGERKPKVYPPIKHEEYYETGEIKKVYYTVNNKKHGEEIVYYPTGEKNKVSNWAHGLLDGSYTVFYRDQQVYILRNYSKGNLVDEVIKDKNGNVITK